MHKIIIKILATNINIWRTQNQLSKRKQGDICLLSESTIRNIEQGTKNTELKTLVRLRIGFNVLLSTLFEINSVVPKIRTTPIKAEYIEKLFSEDKSNIGKRLLALHEFRGLDKETLSILSYNIDYSDTLKYLRGEENIELFTLLKYADGLEVDLNDILNYGGEFPGTKFYGKIKE